MYTCDTPRISAEERERLILEHMPQVRLIARRIHERLPSRVPIDDLISTGTLGLIAAIDNFDAAQGVKLKTYAEYRIRGAILDGLREVDWAPRQKRKMARSIESAIAILEQRLSRAPTEEEIATEIGLPVEEYRQQLIGMEGLQLADLECGTGDNSFTLLKYVASDDESSPARILERSSLEDLVARLIEKMPNVERTVLSLYYHEELNLREIAEIMDLHISRISQLKTQAILRLRGWIGRQWPVTGGK